MIKLKISEYCSECPDFEPYVDKNAIEAYDFRNNKAICSHNTVVSCQHSERCEYIRQFIEKESKKND